APQPPICMTLKRESTLPRCRTTYVWSAKISFGLAYYRYCIARLQWNLVLIYPNSMSSICAIFPRHPRTMHSAAVEQAAADSQRSFCPTAVVGKVEPCARLKEGV